MSVGIVDKSTGDRIPTAGMPAIDDALSLSSTNPVQNAIITAALADKQDKTDNNLNTTSKDVVGAINEVSSNLTSLTDVVGWGVDGGNELIPRANGEKNGVTYTRVYDNTGYVVSYSLSGSTTQANASVFMYNFPVKDSATNYKVKVFNMPSTASHIIWDNTSSSSIPLGTGVITVPANHNVSMGMYVTTSGTDVTGGNVQIMATTNTGDPMDTYYPTRPVIGKAVADMETRLEAVESGVTNVGNQIVGVKAGYLSSSSGNTVYIPAKTYPRVLIVLNNQGTDGADGRPTIVGILSMGQSGAYRFEQLTNVTDYALTFTYDNVTDPDNPRFAVQYIKVSDSTTHTYLRGFYLTADLRWA